MLQGDQTLLVVDREGRLVASAGPGASALDDLATSVRGNELTIQGLRRHGNTAERVALQFLGGPMLARSLDDGREAIGHVVPIPRGGPSQAWRFSARWTGGCSSPPGWSACSRSG